MTFSSIGRRPFRLLAVAATAVAAIALTVSTAVAAPASKPAAPAPAASAHANRAVPKSHDGSLASTISLVGADACSASLARFPSSKATDQALMLTNGHCWEGVFIMPGVVLVDLPSSRTADLIDGRGQAVAQLRTDRLLYATMTGTDVALYRLTQTFAQIKHATGLKALTIASTHPKAGTTVSIPSGYWKITYTCAINGFVPSLQEAIWTWHDSIRYQYPYSNCQLIGGTSGSPLLDNHSGKIVGINNTANADGETCTLNNPCEVDANGTVTAIKGEGYGQETYWFTTCLTRRNTIDLNKAGCLLPKP